MKKIGLLLPLINIIGAVTTFTYFHVIMDSSVVAQNIPKFYSPLFFLIATAVIMIPTFTLIRRKSMKTLFDVAYGKIKINSLEKSEIHHLQREALQFPMVIAAITAVIWVMAGFIFGFLDPLIASHIFNIKTPNLIYCLRQFLGISLLGGGVTTLALYFILDNVW